MHTAYTDGSGPEAHASTVLPLANREMQPTFGSKG